MILGTRWLDRDALRRGAPGILVIPVGLVFIDFANALIIRGFVNWVE